MRNSPAPSFRRNALQTVTSTVGASALLAALMLVLPKFMPQDEYGYYQLYLFYSTYLGYVTFGIADGLFLRYGGSTLQSIPAAVISGHFRILSLLAVISMSAISAAALIVASPQAKTVISAACAGTVFYLLRSLLTFVYQAANLSELYATTTFLERLIHLAGALGLAVCGMADLKLIVLTDVFARFCGLTFAGIKASKFVLAKPLPATRTLAEVATSIRVGIFVNMAALATVLVTASSRFAAERGFGVELFAEISLAFSLQNIILTVITPISLVMLPSLRRQHQNALPQIFDQGMSAISPILVLALIAYFPLSVFVNLWLPDYAHLSAFVAAMMPIIIFETKTRLFSIPFLQSLRRERVVAAVNIACLGAAILMSWIAVSALRSTYVLAFSLTIVVILRSFVLEICARRTLGISSGKHFSSELFISVLFLISTADDTGRWWWIPTSLFWLTYIFMHRSSFRLASNVARRKQNGALPTENTDATR